MKNKLLHTAKEAFEILTHEGVPSDRIAVRARGEIKQFNDCPAVWKAIDYLQANELMEVIHVHARRDGTEDRTPWLESNLREAMP